MEKSPRLNFKGYNFFRALYRNKTEVKVILSLVASASYLTNFDLQIFLYALAASGIALAGKILFDAFDYFFTEVEL